MCMISAVHPHPTLSNEDLIHSVPVFMQKTNIKSEKTVYLRLRYNLLDAQLNYASFLCKTIDQKFSGHLKTRDWSSIPSKAKILCIAPLQFRTKPSACSQMWGNKTEICMHTLLNWCIGIWSWYIHTKIPKFWDTYVKFPKFHSNTDIFPYSQKDTNRSVSFFILKIKNKVFFLSLLKSWELNTWHWFF